MKAHELLSFWETQGLRLSDGEGWRVNVPARVTGILITWLPSLEAIAEARRQNCNVIIAREQFNFPPDYSGAALDRHLSDRISLPRLAALLAGDIGIFRAQESLDGWHRAALAAALDLDDGVDNDAIAVPRGPVTASGLAARAWERLDHPHMRVAGDLSQPVRRVGLLHGSSGCGHRVAGLLPLLERGVDVLIAGELDEYPLRAALDMGVPAILLGQAASLAPGFRRLAAALRGCFGDVLVEAHVPASLWQAV